MKTILFYRTFSGKCPVEEFLETLSDSEVSKVLWVLKLVQEIDPIPATYFKKLANTEEIWEVRIQVSKKSFRLLGFMEGKNLVILTNSFSKKSQKTPRKEIRLAENRRKDYLARRDADG